jgi:sugar (pentulose or hexulose) kinase
MSVQRSNRRLSAGPLNWPRERDRVRMRASRLCRSVGRSVGCYVNYTDQVVLYTQIRKIATEQADVYANTERISLISSFLPSLLLGDYAAVDASDAAGMNLMNLNSMVCSHVIFVLVSKR